MRALGASARSAATHAGYHPHGSHLIERRLKSEIETRKAQLRGNGATTWTLSSRDVHHVLRAELARIADRFGPNQKAFEEQAIRSLAQQVKLSDANEHLKRIGSKLSREAKAGGVMPRTLEMRALCRALIIEIGKFKGTQDAAEQFSPGRKAPVVTGSEYLTGTPTREGAREAADRCPAHPSQPRACRLCAFAAPPSPGYEP